MAKNPDTLEMLDTSPGSSGRGKWIGLAALVLGLAAMALYIWQKEEPGVAQSSVEPAATAPAASAPAASAAFGSSASTPAPPAPAAPAAVEPIKETVYFAFNQAEIASSEMPRLKEFWAKIANQTGGLTVAGHADALGSEEYNQKLSQSRALAVASILKEWGLNERYTLELQPHGEMRPVADNHSEEGRARNRRAEITFAAKK